MVPPPRDLSDDEKKMLAWIEKAGALSPSRLAAETQTLPQETWTMVNQLAEWGLVVLREDPDSVDGTLIFAAPMQAQEQIKKSELLKK